MEVFEYGAPSQVAKTMSELYPEEKQREEIQILDVAAGTGLVGQEVSASRIQMSRANVCICMMIVSRLTKNTMSKSNRC